MSKPKSRQSLAEFGASNQRGVGNTCALRDLPPEVGRQLMSSTLFNTTIRNWLKKEYNIIVGETSIGRHRKKGCTCHDDTKKPAHARRAR